MFANMFKVIVAASLLASVPALAQSNGEAKKDNKKIEDTTGRKEKKEKEARDGVIEENDIQGQNDKASSQESARVGVKTNSTTGRAAQAAQRAVEAKSRVEADAARAELSAIEMTEAGKSLGLATSKFATDFAALSLSSAHKAMVGILNVKTAIKNNPEIVKLSQAGKEHFKSASDTILNIIAGLDEKDVDQVSVDTLSNVAKTYIVDVGGESKSMTAEQLREHYLSEENWEKINNGAAALIRLARKNHKKIPTLKEAQLESARQLIRKNHNTKDNYMTDEEVAQLAKEIVDEKGCMG